MRNSVCKYIRNSPEFRGIPGNFTAKNTAEFRGISRNSVCFSKNSVFRRKSKTHFRGHPSHEARIAGVTFIPSCWRSISSYLLISFPIRPMSPIDTGLVSPERPKIWLYNAKRALKKCVVLHKHF
jgi:hypothetical protein